MLCFLSFHSFFVTDPRPKRKSRYFHATDWLSYNMRLETILGVSADGTSLRRNTKVYLKDFSKHGNNESCNVNAFGSVLKAIPPLRVYNARKEGAFSVLSYCCYS